MVRTATVPNPLDITIDFLFLASDEAYYVYWPTKLRDWQAFSEIRLFYEKLRRTMGDNHRAMPDKLSDCLLFFDKTGEESPKFSLEEFLNEAEFRNILRRQVPYDIRINTPYGDFGYDTELSEEQVERKLASISHLDLSEQLPALIFKTHRDQATIEQQNLFRLHLQTQLAEYGR